MSEYLEFDAASPYAAVSTVTAGWKALTHSPLYGVAPRVGENRSVGGPGRLAVDHEFDEWPITLRLRFNGRFDKDGAPYSDRVEGVRTNVLYVRDNLLIPSLSERDITFYRLDGEVETGAAVVKDWEAAEDPASGGDIWLASLRFVIPAGVLTLIGS